MNSADIERNENPVPEIRDDLSNSMALVDTEDDDCILIPQIIETIDLCNMTLPNLEIRQNAFDPKEVIEIQDSPSIEAHPTTAKNAEYPPRKSLTDDVKSQLAFEGPKAIEIDCPICLELIHKREPVSTICGHLFCKKCLQVALKITKKCPICKRGLTAKSSYHDIFLGS